MVNMWTADKIYYRNSDNYIRAYQGSELVWIKPIPPSETYYISWTPSNVSGTFVWDNDTYYLEDYSGCFSWSNGNIGGNNRNFKSCNFETMETNTEKVGLGTFRSCSVLTQANLPECVSVGQYAFGNCSSLSQISLPKCSYVSTNTFIACSSLSQINLPECVSVGQMAFANCSMLSDISLPKCSYVGPYAFAWCDIIGTISLPNCSYIGSSAFEMNLNLTGISLPNCEYIGEDAFYYCDIRSLNLSKCLQIGSSAFVRCKNLSVVYLSECDLIEPFAFYNCTSLQSIYLYTSYRCALNNSNAFRLTGITPSTGSIFVPGSLVNSYKGSVYNEWSYFKNRIFAIPT